VKRLTAGEGDEIIRSKTSSRASAVWLEVVELEVPLLKEGMILWDCEMYNLCPETEHTHIRANFEWAISF
jgi:hypothetical protein